MSEQMIYFDENGKIVNSREEACKFVIRTIDDKGKLTEKWGYIDPNEDGRQRITQEDYDYLVSQGFEMSEEKYRIVDKIKR